MCTILEQVKRVTSRPVSNKRAPQLCYAALVFCAGCSQVYVSNSQRTTSALFDGSWVGVIDKPASLQYAADDTLLSCSALQAALLIEVNIGVVRGMIAFDNNVSFTTNLNDRGEFYAEVPKESSYLVNGRSRFGAYEYHVFDGRLANHSDTPATGYYRDAIGQMGTGGCKYAIDFKRAAT
jgi:hypothetical protein